MLTRRGFLGTMIAAAVTAVAKFDPTKGLWVPGLPEPTTAAPLIEVATQQPGAVLELNALAMRFAQALGDQVRKKKLMVLQEVMAERAGHVNLGLIRLTDEERGYFDPAATRTLTYLQGGTPEDAAFGFARELSYIDAMAPIGSQLRPGVAFSDVEVGLATDPASGISARAIRFTPLDSKPQVQLEVAGGRWHPKRLPVRNRGAMRAGNYSSVRLDPVWEQGLDLTAWEHATESAAIRFGVKE